MNTYRYEPLPDKDSIRLLELLPGHAGEQLVCHICFANISKPPPYIALSYVWGNPSDTVALVCDGGNQQITFNLAKALRRLRHAQELQTVWVDAVCIDQSNVAERGEQVEMMGLIYQRSVGVTIHLGEDPENEASGVFAAISESVGAITRAINDAGRYPGEEELMSPDDAMQLDITNPVFQAIVRFYSLPWFSRTWVLQEVGLAPVALAIYGEANINFHQVGLYAMLLRRSRKALLARIPDLEVGIERAFHTYMMFSPNNKLTDYVHLLDDARPYQASDPRDKVYALLAHRAARGVFARPGTGQDVSGERVIEPDYSKLVSEVYRELAVRLIRRTEELEILSAVQHEPDMPISVDEYPSWVPRWDRYYGTTMLGRFSGSHLAGANSSAVVVPSQNPNVLKLRVIQLPDICVRSHVLRSSDFNLKPLPVAGRNPIALVWVQTKLNDYTSLPYPGGGSIKEAYFKTWTAGAHHQPDGSEITTRMADADAYWLRFFEEDIDLDELSESEKLYHARLQELARGGDWQHYREAVAQVCHGRKYFMTDQGFFGLGPGALELDDRVCVPFGSDVPLVIRPLGTQYQLVGECYVHGLMQGQAVRTVKKNQIMALPQSVGELKVEDIELR